MHAVILMPRYFNPRILFEFHVSMNPEQYLNFSLKVNVRRKIGKKKEKRKKKSVTLG
jgi:hypothetical protein